MYAHLLTKTSVIFEFLHTKQEVPVPQKPSLTKCQNHYIDSKRNGN